MDEGQLESLGPRKDQELALIVNNASSDSFSKVSLTLRVFSEDTALSGARYYQAKVENLKAGDSKTARFPLDLSPISDPQEEVVYAPEDQERSRIVLEVQATTPEGISTVKTAVLPFASGNST